MAISATYRTDVEANDSAPAIAGLSASSLTFNAYNTAATLNSGTPVVVTKKANFVLTLSGSSGTIDFTALPDAAGTQTFSGLKIQAIKIRNPSANVMSITKGASNGLGLTTSGTSFTIIIPPAYTSGGQTYPGEWVMLTPEGTPDVSGSVKTWDVTGTSTQTLECTFLAG